MTYRILRLQVENFMRVVAVDISPDGYLIPITGKNAEGKSSVINAIWAALQWRAAAGKIPEPVRRGEEKAIVKVDLGGLVITRTWTGDKTQLQVTARDGVIYKSPQAILDKLVSEIGFDPLEFVRMQPRDQRTTLMDLLEIDFSELEQEKAELLQEKKLTDSLLKSIELQLNELPEVPEDTPDEEVSAGDLIQKIQSASSVIQLHNKQLQECDAAYNTISRYQAKIQELESEIKRYREFIQKVDAEYVSLKTLTDAFVPPDIDSLNSQLSNIEQTNKAIRLKHQRIELETKQQAAYTELEEITQGIVDIDQDKVDCLARAKFPVPGLSFDESGILLNGVPFAQASTAEQIRVSLAMGIAMNPNLKVLLIRDGNALDSVSLKIVEEMAKDNEMQIWMERVDESGQMGVIIENGAVKHTNGQKTLLEAGQ